MSAKAGQQHPLGIYYKFWTLLFVLSTLSYLVDYFDFQEYLRWTLILIFMVLKAGFIVAIFMRVMWERMALVFTILGAPVVLLLLISVMVIEVEYTFGIRVPYRRHDTAPERIHETDVHGGTEEEH